MKYGILDEQGNYDRDIILAEEFPHTSFEDPLPASRLPARVVEVHWLVQPSVGDFQRATLMVKATYNSELKRWEKRWDVHDKSAEEQQAALELIKARKCAKINEDWVNSNQTTFEYAGKTFSYDAFSKEQINWTNGYVALNNALPEGWVGGWKANDNTFVPITTVEQWKDFYAAIGVTGIGNFMRAQSLKSKVGEITDPRSAYAELDAIRW